MSKENTDIALRVVKAPLPVLQVTAERLRLICSAVEMGVTFEVAAQSLGINRRIVYQLKRDAVSRYNEEPRSKEFTPEYTQLLDELIAMLPEAEAKAEVKWVEIINDAILAQGKFAEELPDTKLAMKMLEKRAAERWDTKQPNITKIEFTPTKALDVKKLTNEELEALIVDGEIVNTEQTTAVSED